MVGLIYEIHFLFLYKGVNIKFVDEIPPNMERDGVLAFFASLDEFKSNFEMLLELFPAKSDYGSESPASSSKK